MWQILLSGITSEADDHSVLLHLLNVLALDVVTARIPFLILVCSMYLLSDPCPSADFPKELLTLHVFFQSSRKYLQRKQYFVRQVARNSQNEKMLETVVAQ